MHAKSFYLVNGITFYRALAGPVILVFIVKGEYSVFKYLLLLSFFTDAVDGYFARKFKVNSEDGARLDSIADDLTILAAMVGMIAFKRSFLIDQINIFIALFVLFSVQTIMALIRYKKTTSFHTYLAKTSAILQGLSLLQIFFFAKPQLVLFYTSAIFTAVELAEETIIVLLVPSWKANVKGLYWIWKDKRK